jgi:hypothetical protein
LTRILIFTFQYADNNKNIFSQSKLSQWYPGTKESDQTTSGQKGLGFLVGIGREREQIPQKTETNLQKTLTVNFQCLNNNHPKKKRKEKKREEMELFELFLKYFNHQYKLSLIKQF